ncbi:hypothetical protein ACFQ3H_13475, partial [Paralysiella testudinis]|uniref:hypothetical protein n=1 Tax=Paralysiella testudinis TaxID=2809020 RepID=UPI00362F28F0
GVRTSFYACVSFLFKGMTSNCEQTLVLRPLHQIKRHRLRAAWLKQANNFVLPNPVKHRAANAVLRMGVFVTVPSGCYSLMHYDVAKNVIHGFAGHFIHAAAPCFDVSIITLVADNTQQSCRFVRQIMSIRWQI